ncbi:TPA: diguanylate cyclase [Clostridioides difficile]
MENKQQGTILVVDDSVLMCDLIDKALTKDNFNVKKAFNAIEAKEFLEEFIPDIILLDIILPDNSGFDFCKDVKSNVRTADIPIIFITSKNEDTDIVRGFGVGAIDYMVKPFSMTELKARIMAHLEVKKSQDKLKKINKELESSLEKLNRLVVRDYLTGLYNRRHIINQLMEQRKINQYKETSISLILGDIDDFKVINDTYGHDAGDFVLTVISSIIKKNCRQIDTVSRWGGEEFLIMLTNTPIEGAKILSERIRKEVKEFDFNYKENKIKCTITLGVVEVNSNISLEENISLADKAMYEGKSLGKDCSVVSTMKGLKKI